MRLDKNGLEGVVDLRIHKDKFSFDKWEMSLASKGARFALGQQVIVEYLPFTKPRGAQAAFSIVTTEANGTTKTADDSSSDNNAGASHNNGPNEQETA